MATPRNSTGYSAGMTSTYRLEDLADALSLKSEHRNAGWRTIGSWLGIDHTTLYHLASDAARGRLPPPRSNPEYSWTAKAALDQVQLCLRDLQFRGELGATRRKRRPRALGDGRPPAGAPRPGRPAARARPGRRSPARRTSEKRSEGTGRLALSYLAPGKLPGDHPLRDAPLRRPSRGSVARALHLDPSEVEDE